MRCKVLRLSPVNVELLSPWSHIEGKNSEINSQNENTKSFSQVLKEKIEEANQLQLETDSVAEQFIAGEPIELHEMVIAMEKADLAIRHVVQIRNKLLEAYKELVNMQL